MSTTPRGARPDRPELPTGRIELRPPPLMSHDEGSSGVMMNAIPMLGSLGSIALMTTMGPASGGRSYLMAGTFLFATLAFVAVQLDRQRRQRTRQVTRSRSDYLRYLAGVRQVVRAAADRQRRALAWDHPDPVVLPALAAERTRVWERGTCDDGFLSVRYGVGSRPLAVDLVLPGDAPTGRVDPVGASALHRLVATHGVQPRLPVSLDLRAWERIEVFGAEEPARSLARAVVCSATAFHSPDHLVVAVLAADRRLFHWDWLKWLPHAHSTQAADAVGPRRMVSASPDELAALLPAGLSERPRSGAGDRPALPHLLLVTDGHQLAVGEHVGGLPGVTVLDLSSRWGELGEVSRLRLDLDLGPRVGGKQPVHARRARGDPVVALADQCDLVTAEAFARRLAPVRAGSAGAAPAAGVTSQASDLMDLLGLGDVGAFDPLLGWRSRSTRDRLRVPIGVGDGGVPVHLDLKEAAQQGMGPHGLVIGATGSGKSELLRTLVLGLALTHSPEQLNLVLVDFKGGASFAGMSGLPHVSAVITNLVEELSLVDRMQDALAGELVRRQQLLRAAGNFASVRDHQAARDAGQDLDPVPSLLIVVDEFSELLAARPELIDLFVAIGRLGRSLGLHLLLASQRLEEGRLRGLESHLSYRIGLRTFSAAESRSVLGAPDAYQLPPVPGLGYLKPGPSELVRFTAAYVSGPARSRPPARRGAGGRPRRILPFTLGEIRPLQPVARGRGAVPGRHPAAGGGQPRLLELAVARMSGCGPPAHRVWLPPLDRPPTLDQLMTDLAEDPELGLVSRHWRRPDGGLSVPVGTVDRPREQRRDTLVVDLGGSAGHVAVVGGPRSGKSTVLSTLVAALALTTTPRESQFFVLDFGGGVLGPLAGLPHVAGVGSRAEPDVVRRVVAEVRGIVARREGRYPAPGIGSVESCRAGRAAGPADDGYGDVFLVVDGWSTLRAEFGDLEAELQQVAERALGLGFHLLAGAARWADFRAAMRDAFGSRLELRLGDPMDSEVDRRSAALVPTGRPGRGLTRTGHHYLAALPRIDGSPSADSLGPAVHALVARVAAAWPGPTGPKLRLLPARIGLDRVVTQAEQEGLTRRLLLLGVVEPALAPVGLDVDAEPHLLLFGDGRSGKSTVLRSYLREVVRTRTAEEAQVVVVDYRRSLLGEVPEDYLLAYLTSATQASPVLDDLAGHLRSRLPGPDVTSHQLRNRSWWSGAEVFVVVDDYDLVTTARGGPVQVLQPLLAQAGDVGLHLAVAHRSGGASRVLYEPVVQTLRDLAAPGLLLSGSPDEGPLLGGLRPVRAIPGRGRLVTRDRGVEVVQTAWTERTD